MSGTYAIAMSIIWGCWMIAYALNEVAKALRPNLQGDADRG